jgi:hypothetical protein
MVIGIEPLGHLERRLARRCVLRVIARRIMLALVSDTARQGEVARQVRFLTGEFETGRLAAEQLDVVRDLIVVGEIAHRDKVQPGIALLQPMAAAQHCAGFLQLLLAGFAAPMTFKGELQLALQADPGVSECMRLNHDNFYFE